MQLPSDETVLQRLSPQEANAMTVNERLASVGLLAAYDRALAAGDPEAVTRILEKVYLSPPDIQRVLEHHHLPRRGQT